MGLQFAGVGLIQFDGPAFPNVMTSRLDVEGASNRLTQLLATLAQELSRRGHHRCVLADIRPFRKIQPARRVVWSTVSESSLWICVDPGHPSEYLLAREILPYLHHAHFPFLSSSLEGLKREAVAEVERFLVELQFDMMTQGEGFDGLEGYLGLSDELKDLWQSDGERGMSPRELLDATLSLGRLDAFAERLLERTDLSHPDRQRLEHELEARHTATPRLASIASAMLTVLRRQREANQRSFRAALEEILTQTSVLRLVGLCATRTSDGVRVTGLPGGGATLERKVGRNDPCPCGSGKNSSDVAGQR